MSDRERELLALAEPDDSALAGEPSGNDEVRAEVGRILALIESATDAAVEEAESELGIIVLPKGRARLTDHCMSVATADAMLELRATIPPSVN